MPNSTARYATLPCLLQSFVAHFSHELRGWWICILGAFSWQFWGSLTKRDETGLCGCLSDLTVTFLRSLLPLYLQQTLSPGQACGPFSTLALSLTPKNPCSNWHFFSVQAVSCSNHMALMEPFKHNRNILARYKQTRSKGNPNKRLYSTLLWHIILVWNVTQCSGEINKHKDQHPPLPPHLKDQSNNRQNAGHWIMFTLIVIILIHLLLHPLAHRTTKNLNFALRDLEMAQSRGVNRWQ